MEVDIDDKKAAEKTSAAAVSPRQARAIRQLRWARYACTVVMAIGIIMVLNPKASELSLSGLVILLIGFFGRYRCQLAERSVT